MSPCRVGIASYWLCILVTFNRHRHTDSRCPYYIESASTLFYSQYAYLLTILEGCRCWKSDCITALHLLKFSVMHVCAIDLHPYPCCSSAEITGEHQYQVRIDNTDSANKLFFNVILCRYNTFLCGKRFVIVMVSESKGVIITESPLLNIPFGNATQRLPAFLCWTFLTFISRMFFIVTP